MRRLIENANIKKIILYYSKEGSIYLPPSKVSVENVYSFSSIPMSVWAPISSEYQFAGCSS